MPIKLFEILNLNHFACLDPKKSPLSFYTTQITKPKKAEQENSVNFSL